MKGQSILLLPDLAGRYRKEIMGAAILGILLYHGRAMIFGGVVGYLFAAVKYFMQIGVDIFLLLSGFGCCRSLFCTFQEKYVAKGIGHFYLRRVRRVIPK